MPYGLADEERARTLFVPIYRKFVYDGESSFDKDSAGMPFSPETLYGFSPQQLELKEVVCEIRRLDSQSLQPLFIKIDVQGYESHVIRGGMDTIKRHEPILMVEAFHGNPEVGGLVQALGYDAYLFDDTGFYKSNQVTEAVNTFLMTPARARTVRLSAAAAVASGAGAAPGRQCPATAYHSMPGRDRPPAASVTARATSARRALATTDPSSATSK